MSNNKFVFWGADSKPNISDGIVGCSSHGFFVSDRFCLPNEAGMATWEHELPDTVLNGTYQNVLDELLTFSYSPQFCIVLYKKAAGFEDFICKAAKIFPDTTFIGGGAAFVNGLDEGELLPDCKELCVLVVNNGDFSIETLNIYNDLLEQVEVQAASIREIRRVRQLPDGEWQDAISFYRDKQKQLGIDKDNFESLCFCDKNRRNLHCSIAGETLFVGANLPDDNSLFLNFISEEEAAAKLADFIADTDCLIFGCAGIRSLIKEPLLTGKRSLAGFMFGEIVHCGKYAELGNMMLAKLKVK